MYKKHATHSILLALVATTSGCIVESESELIGHIDKNNSGEISYVCDASILKLADGEFLEGGDGSWQMIVNWHGAEECEQQQLCVEDELPVGQFYKDNNEGWDCTDNNGTVTCCATDFDPSSSYETYKLNLAVSLGVEMEQKTIENCASVNMNDDDDQNNISCAQVDIIPAPEYIDLSLVKAVSQIPVAGGNGKFKFKVMNYGNGDASNVTITDVLPEGMTFDDAIIGAWTCLGDDNVPETVTCSYENLVGEGWVEELILSVNVAFPTDEQLFGTNCASVDSSHDDVNINNNEGCVEYEIEIPEEICGNCIDDNGNGEVDEDCEYE